MSDMTDHEHSTYAREINYPSQENLEITIGSVKFRDEVIKNLLDQINNLRQFILNDDWSPNIVDDIQYKHLREQNETNS